MLKFLTRSALALAAIFLCIAPANAFPRKITKEVGWLLPPVSGISGRVGQYRDTIYASMQKTVDTTSVTTLDGWTGYLSGGYAVGDSARVIAVMTIQCDSTVVPTLTALTATFDAMPGLTFATGTAVVGVACGSWVRTCTSGDRVLTFPIVDIAGAISPAPSYGVLRSLGLLAAPAIRARFGTRTGLAGTARVFITYLAETSQ